MRAVLLLTLLALAGCRDREAVPRPHRVFFPAVIQSSTRGHNVWTTGVTLTNPGTSDITVRAGRWPPRDPASELSEIPVPAGATVSVPLLVPLLPSVSSLTFDSEAPFEAQATIRGRRRDGSLLPPLTVPAVPGAALAREGETLRAGPFVRDGRERSQLCFTLPWTERETTPFLVDLRFLDASGRELKRESRALPGVPFLVLDPWKEFGLPEGTPFHLEVTLVGSARGRTPILGLWLYGVTQEDATSISRFLEVTKTGRKP